MGLTTFYLSAIPLGGYVELTPEPSSEDIVATETHDHTDNSSFQLPSNTDYFDRKPYYQKFFIMAGGILFNLAFAFFTLWALFSLGMPKTTLLYPDNATTTIEKLAETSPLAPYLKAGDTIQAINNRSIHAFTDITQAFQLNDQSHTPLAIDVLREGVKQEINIPSGIALKGILFSQNATAALSTKEAFVHAVNTIKTSVGRMFSSLKSAASSRSLTNFGGPLMIFFEGTKGAQHGVKIFLLFLALISITLAVMNVLPLPMLDGGQLLLYTIEAILGRKIPEKFKLIIMYGSWVLMGLLVVYLTTQDFRRIFFNFFNK